MNNAEPTPYNSLQSEQGKDTDLVTLPNLDLSKFQSKESINSDEINIREISAQDIKGEVLQINKKFDELPHEVTGEKLLSSNITEIPCLVEPFFQQTGLGCLAGSSDTGKSSLLRQLAVSIVNGEPDFLGFRINATHRSVIYVSTEDLERETAFLLRQQSKNCKPESLHGLRFIFNTENLKDVLIQSLSIRAADLVIIDCFADAYGGDLKDTQKIRTYLQPFQDIAGRFETLICFLHHTGKRTENVEPSKNNLLSGQGFEAKMRVVIELRADLVHPSHRHLCIVKGNYLPGRFKKESHVLEFDEPSFTFFNTGDRTPFELLVKQVNNNNSKDKYEKAIELRGQGLSYQKIAETLGYSSKGSVTKLFKKYEGDDPVSKEVSKGNDGNGEETQSMNPFPVS